MTVFENEGVQARPGKPTKVAVVLSTDLKNSVIVEAETWAEVDELLPHARELYAGLIQEFGVKTYGSGGQSVRGGAGARSTGGGGAVRPTGGTAPRQVAQDGESVECSNCGKPIYGQAVRGEFQTAAEIASWGEKKGLGALCIGEGGCYSQLVKSAGNRNTNVGRGGYNRGGNSNRRPAPRSQDLEDLPF